MYTIGDLIIYGGTGVCRVEEIRSMGGRGEEKKDFYVLNPLFQDGTIYAPVNGKVYMRPVMTAEEAESLIGEIPTISAKAYHDKNFNQLAAHYDQIMGRHDSRELVGLMMSIYAKKQYVEQQKRKFGQIDSRYMKRAEDLLFGELSVALDIDRDQVQDYIAAKVDGFCKDVEPN